MSMITRLMKCSIPIAIIKGEVVMKKIILLLSAVLLWALPVSVSAQNKNNDKAKQQRKEQFDRFCKFRRDFMMKQIAVQAVHPQFRQRRCRQHRPKPYQHQS